MPSAPGVAESQAWPMKVTTTSRRWTAGEAQPQRPVARRQIVRPVRASSAKKRPSNVGR